MLLQQLSLITRAWLRLTLNLEQSLFVSYRMIELEVIKQWLKTTEMKSCLSQSKFFLKVLSIFYQNSNTSLPITPTQIVVALFGSPLFESVILAFMPCIMKASPNYDILVTQINIWDFQRDSKGRTFINHSFNFGQYVTIVQETNMYPRVSQYYNYQCQEHSTHAYYT